SVLARLSIFAALPSTLWKRNTLSRDDRIRQRSIGVDAARRRDFLRARFDQVRRNLETYIKVLDRRIGQSRRRENRRQRQELATHQRGLDETASFAENRSN